VSEGFRYHATWEVTITFISRATRHWKCLRGKGWSTSLNLSVAFTKEDSAVTVSETVSPDFALSEPCHRGPRPLESQFQQAKVLASCVSPRPFAGLLILRLTWRKNYTQLLAHLKRYKASPEILGCLIIPFFDVLSPTIFYKGHNSIVPTCLPS
jgi:hypothetical protein